MSVKRLFFILIVTFNFSLMLSAQDNSPGNEEYEKGVAYEKEGNHFEAYYWYELAAEKGNTESMIMLGILNIQPYDDMEPDYDQAFMWMNKAAEVGNPRAMFFVGSMYVEGMGVEKDNEKALYWIQKAAENGDEEAVKVLEASTKRKE